MSSLSRGLPARQVSTTAATTYVGSASESTTTSMFIKRTGHFHKMLCVKLFLLKIFPEYIVIFDANL